MALLIYAWESFKNPTDTILPNKHLPMAIVQLLVACHGYSDVSACIGILPCCQADEGEAGKNEVEFIELNNTDWPFRF
ncbi:hypothetical protein AAG906_022958 [Vitis piasezkii]